mmetsp:Transcript_43610/g.69747  ORF Transcript_43610/g.69747 Transcript_43610/m.69747 type:complete len:959 (+) Transcript_43610:373-3249(+)
MDIGGNGNGAADQGGDTAKPPSERRHRGAGKSLTWDQFSFDTILPSLNQSENPKHDAEPIREAPGSIDSDDSGMNGVSWFSDNMNAQQEAVEGGQVAESGRLGHWASEHEYSGGADAASLHKRSATTIGASGLSGGFDLSTLTASLSSPPSSVVDNVDVGIKNDSSSDTAGDPFQVQDLETIAESDFSRSPRTRHRRSHTLADTSYPGLGDSSNSGGGDEFEQGSKPRHRQSASTFGGGWGGLSGGVSSTGVSLARTRSEQAGTDIDMDALREQVDSWKDFFSDEDNKGQQQQRRSPTGSIGVSPTSTGKLSPSSSPEPHGMYIKSSHSHHHHGGSGLGDEGGSPRYDPHTWDNSPTSPQSWDGSMPLPGSQDNSQAAAAAAAMMMNNQYAAAAYAAAAASNPMMAMGMQQQGGYPGQEMSSPPDAMMMQQWMHYMPYYQQQQQGSHQHHLQMGAAAAAVHYQQQHQAYSGSLSPPHVGDHSPAHSGVGMGRMKGGKHHLPHSGSSSGGSSMMNASICPALLEYRTSGRRPTMEELTGHVVEFSRDAHGSRFVQFKMETATIEEKQILVDEVAEDAIGLMQDTFGNYVIQNFMEHATDGQRVTLGKTMKGHMVQLSSQAHGCRVVQRAIILLPKSLRNELLSELLMNPVDTSKCARNSHATHVMQKVVSLIVEEEKASHSSGLNTPTSEEGNLQTVQLLRAVELAVALDFVAMAVHPHAYRLVLTVMDDCDYGRSDSMQQILSVLKENQGRLAKDQHGNFILQHILNRGHAGQKEMVQKFVSDHVVELSQHKFGSHLVEKCLSCANASQVASLVLQLINPTNRNAEQSLLMMENAQNRSSGGPGQGKRRSNSTSGNSNRPKITEDGDNSTLLLLMQDPYANFVVQRAFDASQGQLRQQLAQEIKSRSDLLQRFTYGRHILLHINRVQSGGPGSSGADKPRRNNSGNRRRPNKVSTETY